MTSEGLGLWMQLWELLCGVDLFVVSCRLLDDCKVSGFQVFRLGTARMEKEELWSSSKMSSSARAASCSRTAVHHKAGPVGDKPVDKASRVFYIQRLRDFSFGLCVVSCGRGFVSVPSARRQNPPPTSL